MTRPERKYADFIWMQILQCYLSAVVYAFSGDKIICCWLSSSRAKLQITWIYFTLHVFTISQMESILWLQLNLKNGERIKEWHFQSITRACFLAKQWTKSITKMGANAELTRFHIYSLFQFANWVKTFPSWIARVQGYTFIWIMPFHPTKEWCTISKKLIESLHPENLCANLGVLQHQRYTFCQRATHNAALGAHGDKKKSSLLMARVDNTWACMQK
jgi:hypothetical protein